MKVLLINGSPDSKGCISTALKESAKILNAEGIETEEQMRVMKDMGVEFIQGFYYSRPIPESEFLEFLARNNPK